MKDVLLFGAGTQSTGLLLMALDGKFPVPEITIFADTMSEPNFVYDYFEKFKEYIEDKYNYKIITVFRGNLREDLDLAKATGARVASLPLFTENGGMIKRQCTSDYKIIPINKHLKKHYNIGRKKKESIPVIRRWFGISLDEIERCRVSGDWWTTNYYPLVEERIYRHEVINYVNNNHPKVKNPPRSSCYFCPFHSTNYWKMLKENHLPEFKKACEVDETIRDSPKLKHKAFLHRGLVPLSKVDFETTQLDIFGECEGYCGI